MRGNGRKRASIRAEARAGKEALYRDAVVGAAEKVFATRGFERAKVQEISAACGLSMGTIYALFPGKEELYKSLLQQRAEELLALVREVVRSGVSARQALRTLIESYVDYFVAHPDFLRMQLRAGAAWMLHGPDTEVTNLHASWQIHAVHAELFKQGMEEGTFRREDPDFCASVLSGMDQVLLADWVAKGMKQSRDQLVDRLEGLVLRTFGTR